MTDLHGEFFGGVAGTSDMVSKSSNGVLQQNNRSQASSSNTISSSVGLALNCHIKNTLLRYRQGRKLSKSLLGLANNSRKISVFLCPAAFSNSIWSNPVSVCNISIAFYGSIFVCFWYSADQEIQFSCLNTLKKS